jgi:hypothetical protein
METARTPPRQVVPPPLRQCQRAAPPVNRLSLHTRHPLMGPFHRLQVQQYLEWIEHLEHEGRKGKRMTVPAGTSSAP